MTIPIIDNTLTKPQLFIRKIIGLLPRVISSDTMGNITIKIPVLRPLLFAAAFEMLQFEPEVTFDFKHPLNENLFFITGFSLGLSFHYGPDYNSDLENRGESFFAIGPSLSGFFAFNFPGIVQSDTAIGIRIFYVPLFSTQRSVGTVIGGAIEAQMYF